MKALVFVYLLLVTQVSFAGAGQCIALGRVGGEDEVCARYNDTDEATCKKADGWAWCAWRATEARGTGPLHVECTKDGIKKVYNTNKIAYGGAGTKSLTAIGFGPNRQDDGIASLQGNCIIVPNVQ